MCPRSIRVIAGYLALAEALHLLRHPGILATARARRHGRLSTEHLEESIFPIASQCRMQVSIVGRNVGCKTVIADRSRMSPIAVLTARVATHELRGQQIRTDNGCDGRSGESGDFGNAANFG